MANTASPMIPPRIGFLRRSLYSVYVVGCILTTAALLAPAEASEWCYSDCEWNPPFCNDPCDVEWETMGYAADGSCYGEESCCEWGICWIKDRNEGSGPCVFNCYNNDVGRCGGKELCAE